MLRRTFADERQYRFIAIAYPVGRDRLDRGSGNSKKFRGWLDTDQSAMLAHDIELMEGPQEFVPSLIRLKRFDDRSKRDMVHSRSPRTRTCRLSPGLNIESTNRRDIDFEGTHNLISPKHF